ncbi:SMP-30/gluconolactonase/LRE family protein [Hyphococcus formosus]|uniref:SMP-30/gluconolactonase/LRE family protein n=1 Tax=Hyphococcus formosus TaxID=3143534 RepID=UPI00398B2240
MRFWLFLFAFFLVILGALSFNLHVFNYFSRIDPVSTAQCTPVSGIPGPEDIDIDRAKGLAFISSQDRRAKDARGAIHVFSLNDPLAAAGFRDRTGGQPEEFRPLGLDYFEDGDVRRLFVVNEAGPSIEIFDIEENGDLTHVETMHERRLMSPNNILVTGPRSFYVTNDARGGREGLIANLSFLFRLGSGEVFFVDDKVWRLEAEGLKFANGLAMSLDQKMLYVAETAGKRIQVFARNPENGGLTYAQTISLDAAPDNITTDNDGAVWVGAMPKPLSVPQLMANRNARAASEVVRISPDGEVSTVYRNDGSEISATTVAARSANKLLIGALYDEKFLFCELPNSVD